MKRKLKEHQHRARRFIRTHKGRALLLMAPGTMKTLTAIRSTVLPALVICRRDDYLTWRLELADDGVPESQMHFIESSSSFVPGNVYDLQKGRVLPQWFFITYDLVKPQQVKDRCPRCVGEGEVTKNIICELCEGTGKVWVKNDRLFQWIRGNRFNTVIADECDAICGVDTDRSDYVLRATRHINRRIGLTGSLFGNRLLDVFTPAKFVDDGRTFGTNWFLFKKKYYLQSGPGWYPRKRAKEEIAQKLKAIAFSVHEDDVLRGLPPKRRILKGAPLNEAQKQTTESLVKAWELVLASGEIIEFDFIMQQIQKLRQVADGFYYIPEKGGQYKWLGAPKFDLLFDLLRKDLRDKPKIVIWGAYNASLSRIQREVRRRNLGKAVPYYDTMSRSERETARLRFRDDPNIRFFIGQQDRGRGMNELVVADTAIYYGHSWKARSREQADRRIRRQGSQRHNRITYYDLVSEGTVDVGIVKSVRHAMNIAQYIYSGLQEGRPLRRLLTFEA